jgi:hypothetical protein
MLTAEKEHQWKTRFSGSTCLRSKASTAQASGMAHQLPRCLAHKAVIKKIRMDELKPPYLLLCNHNAFQDFKVTTAAVFPHRANYVVAIDGFTAPTKKGFESREWL